MLLFVLALVVALLGLGIYDLYNPGTLPVTIAGHHFAAVPSWVPIALGAAVPLTLFLLHALWTGLRIWLLKRAARRWPSWDAPRWPAVEPSRVAWRAREPRAVQAPAPVVRTPPPPVRTAPPPVRTAPPVREPAPSANRRKRASQAPPPSPGPQPAPKRSWLSHRD